MPNKPRTHRPAGHPAPRPYQSARRLPGRDRLYGRRWKEARAHYLRAHPLCVDCTREGRVTAATVVDHKTPHRGDEGLFWDQGNWQSLCEPCHQKKTARGE